jgi:hypothetical protein
MDGLLEVARDAKRIFLNRSPIPVVYCGQHGFDILRQTSVARLWHYPQRGKPFKNVLHIHRERC